MKCIAEMIEFRTADGIMNVKLKGDIDHHSAKAIRNRIDSELFISSPEEIRLDLSDIDFMDSSGLGLILGRYQAATEMGIDFSLFEPSESVCKILKLSGCEKMINIVRRKQK